MKAPAPPTYSRRKWREENMQAEEIEWFLFLVMLKLLLTAMPHYLSEAGLCQLHRLFHSLNANWIWWSCSVVLLGSGVSPQLSLIHLLFWVMLLICQRVTTPSHSYENQPQEDFKMLLGFFWFCFCFAVLQSRHLSLHQTCSQRLSEDSYIYLTAPVGITLSILAFSLNITFNLSLQYEFISLISIFISYQMCVRNLVVPSPAQKIILVLHILIHSQLNCEDSIDTSKMYLDACELGFFI